MYMLLYIHIYLYCIYTVHTEVSPICLRTEHTLFRYDSPPARNTDFDFDAHHMHMFRCKHSLHLRGFARV